MAIILPMTFSNAFSSNKMFASLSIFHRILFPFCPMCQKQKLFKKYIVCRYQIVWSRSYGMVICTHFSQCCIFRCSFDCHSKGFTIKSQGCWYALQRKSQCMIFKSNILPTHISAKQLCLQRSVKYLPKSSHIISPTLSRKGRIRHRVGSV